jgi:hypothetical protein
MMRDTFNSDRKERCPRRMGVDVVDVGDCVSSCGRGQERGLADADVE